MKKISIYILLLFCSLTSFGQITDVALKAQSNVIRNAGIAANTKDRIATMLDSVINTKASRYVNRTFSSTLIFDNDFKMSTTQTADITFSLGTGNLPDRNARVIINGNSTNTCTFPSNWVNGIGVIFDNTKKNKIYLEYDGTDVTYNIVKKDLTDVTAPTYNIQTVTAVSSTSATFNAQTNEAGTVKWMVTTSATAPSKPSTLAGTGAVGSNFGSITMVANITNTASLTGLTASTSYYLWSYAIDASANETAVQSGINFTTTSASFSATSLSLVSSTQIASTATNPTGLAFGSGGTDLPFSISGYTKYSNNGSEQRLFSVSAGSSSFVYQYIISVFSDGQIGLAKYSQGNNSIQQGKLASVSFNTWFHWTITDDGSKTEAGIKIYINGSLATMVSYSAGTYAGMLGVTSSHAAYVGGSPQSAFQYIANGALIDELAVWNKELTAGEVTNVYNAGTPKNLTTATAAANLKSWWRFESSMTDTGTNAYTLSGITTPNYSTDRP